MCPTLSRWEVSKKESRAIRTILEFETDYKELDGSMSDGMDKA